MKKSSGDRYVAWLSHPLFLPSIIVGVTILLWATSLLPEFMTALLFFAAVVAMGPGKVPARAGML
ncbi:hypothetical protein BCZ60_004326 [Salmonella enterica subsp. enterica serovar Enteritidis]|uniref:Uncharacterized protein n=1 Tax=Salmonella enteritidis TaxID=149539 RepID=A0A6Y0SX75_SALEN|nr:hypothetical protein [Salmonella enterica subsp. enterica serovar Enteritidis]EGX3596424.1 hypothetical protein [Salmonella enterica subsp. enterica serovar Enteritidis]HAB1400655.1 hypothetical protein [Salmonella enterica subsp. enterica serovar Enteritidis]HAB3417805.1 hypothetical protein [Salmonella enterica subsp. enterica serovar Enteritidis]HAB3431304.1 hypothetical protein [Salmonella enterica subsp. enterica serovar Enteritidis]